MTIKKISRYASKVFSCLKVIPLLLFCWINSVRFSMKNTVVLFSLIGCAPSMDGGSVVVIFSCQLNCTICAAEDKFVSMFWPENFCCVESSNVNFWRVKKIVVRSKSATRMSPFKILSRTVHGPSKCLAGPFSQSEPFFPNLMEPSLIFRGHRMMLDHRSKRFYWPTKMVLRIAFRVELYHSRKGLECFSENSSIPWNLPTIFHIDRIAEVSRIYLLSLCILLSLSFSLCNAICLGSIWR